MYLLLSHVKMGQSEPRTVCGLILASDALREICSITSNTNTEWVELFIKTWERQNDLDCARAGNEANVSSLWDSTQTETGCRFSPRPPSNTEPPSYLYISSYHHHHHLNAAGFWPVIKWLTISCRDIFCLYPTFLLIFVKLIEII